MAMPISQHNFYFDGNLTRLGLMTAGLTQNCPLPQSAFSYFAIFLASHLTSPGLLRRRLSIQIPSVSHHQLKVVVVVDTG